jgi:hypothetical protein
MKKLLTLAFVVLAYSASIAQCDQLFDFREGTNWTWSNYNKNGKLLGKTIQKVDELIIDVNNRKAVLTVVMSDAKGEQGQPVSMEMACRDGIVYFDMKKFMPAEYTQNEDAELAIESDNLEIPKDMKVGDKLNDGSVKMNISGDSPMAMNMSVNITDRKVVGQEELNTSAGNFDCFVIQQTVSTKMMMTVQVETKEWYSMGTGMVKSESYRKGKLTGYSLLTTFSR